MAPAAHQTRVASPFRARAAYPAPINKASPRPTALGEKTDMLASGDLFITFPTFDDLVPTSLWECLHNTSRHTIHLNPGLDMPQPPACSRWRFRPAELLLQARQPTQFAADSGNAPFSETRKISPHTPPVCGTVRNWPSCAYCVASRADPASWRHSRDGSTNRRRGVGRSGVTRSGQRPMAQWRNGNGGHGHDRDFRV